MLVIQANETIEIEGVKFVVRPARYSDFRQALEEAEKLYKRDGFEPDARWDSVLAANLTVLIRIESWEGIETPSGPAPCDMDAKLSLLAQCPQVVNELADAIKAKEAAVSKNSDPSQIGSSESTLPAKDADGIAESESRGLHANQEESANTQPQA